MEELITALENRITLGEDKVSLQAEVVAHGHSDEDFEYAYSEALARVSKSQSEVGETTAQEDVHEVASSRARGDLHTLAVEPLNKGLIGYWAMLQVGWKIGNESLPTLGGFLVALVLMFPIIFGGLMLIGVLVTVLPESAGSVLVLLGAAVLGYILLVLYATAIGFSFFRGVLKRHEPKPAYWTHFYWSWRHIIGLLLVSFYVQLISNAGFVLFFIPGILASVYLGYALYVYVDEDVRGFDSLIRSFELVYGRFWAILGRKLFLVLIVLLAVVPVGIAVSVYPPAALLVLLLIVVGAYFIVCSTIALFESLQTQPLVHQFSEPDRKNIKTWLRVVVIAAVVFGCISFYSSAMSFDLEKELSDLTHFLSEMRTDGPINQVPGDQDQYEEHSSAALIVSELREARVAADLYHAETGSYLGVCSSPEGINTNMRYAFDAGSKNVSCEDDREWFLAEAEVLDSGVYFCVDSFGNEMQQSTSRKGLEQCVDPQ